MRFPVLILVAVLQLGCAVVYLPGASAPTRMRPEVGPGQGTVTFDMDLARNTADGVEVDPQGNLSDGGIAAVWPMMSLTWQQGLADGLSLQTQLTTSLLLPLPFPVPNGVTVAPVIRVLQNDSLGLHLSPRLLVTNGSAISAGPTRRTADKALAWGAEVPVLLSWRAGRSTTFTAVTFLRGFRLTRSQEIQHDDGPTEGPTPVHNLTWGTGLTLNAVFDLGGFRLGLGVGVEIASDPAAAFGGDGQPHVYPQGGLSLGGHWGDGAGE